MSGSIDVPSTPDKALANKVPLADEEPEIDWKVIDAVRVKMITEWLEHRGYGKVTDATPTASPDKTLFSRWTIKGNESEVYHLERHRDFTRPTFVIGKGVFIDDENVNKRCVHVWVKISDFDEEQLRENLASYEKKLDAMLVAAK